MNLSSDPIQNGIYQGIKRWMQVMLDSDCFPAAVILNYVGIDAMANLARPANKPKVDRHDFMNWVESICG